MNDTLLALLSAAIGSVIAGAFNFFVWQKGAVEQREVTRMLIEVEASRIKRLKIEEALSASYDAYDTAQDLASAKRSGDKDIEVIKEMQKVLRRKVNRFLYLNALLGPDPDERGAWLSKPIASMNNAVNKSNFLEVENSQEQASNGFDKIFREYVRMMQIVDK